MRGLKYDIDYIIRVIFIKNDDVAPDDVSPGDTSSHDMSSDDMSLIGP